MKLKFTNIIDNLKLKQKFAIAVSGGIDSMVLLHLVAQWAREKQEAMPIVLTVNHNLRPETKEEVLFVSRHAEQLGISCHILSWETEEKIKSNVQSRARKARYELLTQWCRQNQVKHLLTAHNLDDQAETFFIRLERGSGVDGLSAMSKKSIFNDIYILRPLLTFSRKVLTEYALSHNVKWIEDPSNRNNKYKRTIYRNFLKISKNPEVLMKRICLTSMHMKRALTALMHYTKIAFDQCVIISALGYIEIKLVEFNQLPEEIATRVFVYSLMAIGGKYYKPRYSSFSSIFNQIWHKDYKRDHTLHGCTIMKSKGNIMILREAAKIIDKTIELKQNETIEYEWDNRFLCTIKNISCNQTVTMTILKIYSQLPEHLKKYHQKIICSLPILVKDEKILAYPHINCDNVDLSISSHLVQENIMNCINYITDEEVFA
ncbi:MAG: tRNA(Ile)-lysidine synthase [Candidatus Mesenet longicola]|uniref:tRNA(Ile)-lysidine synthase n=1 Tax=Candidatus Mesenet longicola TaxID=1892558 RepID=A0A8J3HPF7_9RICK|nr:MAG: tRNA(Ile)-lysidine synthase [Candidatus Mesenet longicola]GHM59263.1 MAG: tRNA(Ile)-lysidine synthase [Candidatus Mesenet longicola]